MLAEYFDEKSLGLDALELPVTIEDFRDYWRQRSLESYGRKPGEAAFDVYQRAIDHLIRNGQRTGSLPPAEVESKVPVPPLVKEYLDFQAIHRGLSKSSINCHRYYLKKLFDYLVRHKISEPVNIPLGILDGFIIELSGDLGRRALGVVVWVLRAFLGYLFFTGREERDRSKEVALPQTFREMTLPKHLSDSQLEQALALVDRQTKYGKRDWAIFMVFTCLGLRAAEVRGLQLSSLDFEARTIRVERAKGKKNQNLPLTPPLEEALRIYLNEARPKSCHQEVFLTFVPPVRPFLRGGTLSAVVSRYLRKVPGLNAYGSHALRFTFARRLREAGAPVGVISKLMGHESIDTTQGYLRIAFEELREVADNYADLL
jgi:site-specific recombinase XerD